MVLLSASIERVGVSRMRFFRTVMFRFSYCIIKLTTNSRMGYLFKSEIEKLLAASKMGFLHTKELRTVGHHVYLGATWETNVASLTII